MSDTVEFLGESFRVADRVGALPIMRFAKAAKSGADANDMDGLVALYDLLAQVIDPADWPRFEAHADAQHADGADLLKVVQEALALVAGRPTGRSSDSSGGPRIIEPSSTDGSSSPVIHRFNQQGRPDLALLVRKRQESLSA